MFCKNCGKEIPDGSTVCYECGAAQNIPDSPRNTNGVQTSTAAKSKIIAALLALLLGGWGIHDFYLGFNGKGIAKILLTCFTGIAGYIWGFVDFILILTGSINSDNNGTPLS